MLFISNVVL